MFGFCLGFVFVLTRFARFLLSLFSVSGSVKLRLQWIHSTPSLLNYRYKFLNTRLGSLEGKKEDALKSIEILANKAESRVKLSLRRKGGKKKGRGGGKEGKERRKSRKTSTLLTNIRRRGSSGGAGIMNSKAIKTLKNAQDAARREAQAQARRVAVLTKDVSTKTLHNVGEVSGKLFGEVGDVLKDAGGKVKGVGNSVVTGEIFKKKGKGGGGRDKGRKSKRLTAADRLEIIKGMKVRGCSEDEV